MTQLDIPYEQLSPQALQELITEFVSGTDDSGIHVSLASKIDAVMKQLKQGKAVIRFDDETETCGIYPI